MKLVAFKWDPIKYAVLTDNNEFMRLNGVCYFDSIVDLLYSLNGDFTKIECDFYVYVDYELILNFRELHDLKEAFPELLI